MNFRESEDIVREHAALQHIIEEIDRHLATIFSSAPLRAADFARAIGCDRNQVDSIFDLLAGRGALDSEAMVECERCQNLNSAAAFREATDDEDGFECSSCGRGFRSRAQSLIVYRMTPEFLARPKREVEGSVEAAILRAAADADSNVFRPRGDFWEMTFERKTVYVKHSVGLEYIAHLLAEPNQYIAAVTLHSLRTGVAPLVSTWSSGRVVDGKAQRDREHRCLELAEQFKEARQSHDLGQIAKLENEMEQLEKEVSKTKGFGGRAREWSGIDRVGKSVSGEVSRARERIGTHHKPLYRHLITAISTGRIFLRYAPEREIDWLT